ncbi:hypothetical protein HHL19_11320 [Streptomyces sp. R302]|uniref:DUF6234 family protein n=1 Tax=unclassified Streptomyces TaxID=2593676 RepID=UPI00145D270F|nr:MULTISPECIES: DUF6234 family protein [unclassified Streptomyces]NML50253.1 hypothetical protein [Streptomyces sp. R301]NML79244.1 hypothetical protein [Streptomyces sp. R302]
MATITSGTSRGPDYGTAIALFLCELLVLPVLFVLYGSGMWDVGIHTGQQHPDPAVRAEAKGDFIRLLALGAVVIAGPLLAFRRWFSGVTQLVVLGGSAVAMCFVETY